MGNNIEQPPQEVHCDTCGRNLVTSIGIAVPAFSAAMLDDLTTKEIYPDLQGVIGRVYNVCFACVLRGFRVRI